MPRVTALRPARPGHVLVELDGARWRTLPLDVAARAGLADGVELDRARARTLRRELRRAEALSTGVKALARRERSERALQQVLERRGISSRDRDEAVAALRRAGAVDDARYGFTRAAALAERGFGDAAIAFKLVREGLDAERADAALQALEPERDRATRLAQRRGGGTRAANWLARRGFAAESVEAAIPAVAAEAGTELGYEDDYTYELPASDSFEIGPET